MRHKPIGAALAAALAAAALTAALASAQVIKAGNLVATIDGKITPTKLPKRKPAPIALRLSGTLKTADKSHPPAIKQVYLEFDRSGHLNTRGLPTCKVGRLQSTLTSQAKRACGAALIGSGHAEAQIAFPEQAPFSAGGPLLIFNGSKGRRQKLILHVYAKVPAPTTFVTTALIGKGKGPYGISARIAVPTITAGQGSLIGFRSKIRRRFRHKGRKQSVLTASCRNGRLRARGEFLFSGGPKLSGTVTRSCRPR